MAPLCVVNKHIREYTPGFRRIANIKWQDLIPNTEVLQRCAQNGIEHHIKRAQLGWSGHLVRMADDRIPKAVFYGGLDAGHRTRGEQRKRYSDVPKARRTYSRLHLFTTRLNCREPIGSRPCSVHCPDYITTRSTPSDSLNAADVYAPWCHLVFRHASVMTAVVIGCYLKSGESRFSWGIC